MPKILIVDDEPGPRQLLKILLRGRGEVTEYETAGEAWAHLQTSGVKYDLVITDVDTGPEGGINGLQLVKNLIDKRKAEGVDPERIIVLSGITHDSVDGNRVSRAAYVNGLGGVFLPKPFYKNDLVAQINIALSSPQKPAERAP